MVTVAQNIVDTLAANGVQRVYGIPGDSLNGFTDALRRNGTTAWRYVRQEEPALVDLAETNLLSRPFD
jgi:pyruvate dehydrogenase (quinone)